MDGNTMTDITMQFTCTNGTFDIKHKCTLKQDTHGHSQEASTVNAITLASAANGNTTDASKDIGTEFVAFLSNIYTFGLSKHSFTFFESITADTYNTVSL